LEEPLFVNPGEEDPSQHIGFRGEVPYAIPGSIKGKQTIQILKLDRDILNDARLRHLKTQRNLYNIIQLASQKATDKEWQDLAAEAERTLKYAISDQAEFAAATRAALQAQFKFVVE
jgi:post-segregation antitoxin (ccd killing protein)